MELPKGRGVRLIALALAVALLVPVVEGVHLSQKDAAGALAQEGEDGQEE